MRHYYVTGPERVEPVEEPIPEPGAGQVLVKLAYTALSPGSNLYVFRTGGYAGRSAGREEAVYMGSGVVAAVGEGVTGFAAGDRVAMVGVGHQEYAVLAEDRLGRVGDGLDLRDAAISYLSAWSVSVLHLGQYAAAETVVVVGLGLVGLSAALMADQMGARVLGIEVDPARLAFARGLGFGPVASPTERGGTERIGEYLGETGADLILETSGSWHGFKQAVSLARDWTRIAVMGIYREPPPADLALDLHGMLYGFPSKFHYQRLQIIGCGYDPPEVTAPNPHLATPRRNFAYTLERAAEGKLPLGKLISHVVNADEIAAVMSKMIAGDREYVGVVFDWTGG
jgi:threonine dehydrogenase-like Zn-dependent dehydrogenase